MFDENEKYIFTIIIVVQLLLVVLKLFKVLTLSWLLVFSPVIVSAVFFIGFIVIFAIIKSDNW